MKSYNPLLWMVDRIVWYKIVHDPTYLGKGGVNTFWTWMILPFELFYTNSWFEFLYNSSIGTFSIAKKNSGHCHLLFVTFILSQRSYDNSALPQFHEVVSVVSASGSASFMLPLFSLDFYTVCMILIPIK